MATDMEAENNSRKSSPRRNPNQNPSPESNVNEDAEDVTLIEYYKDYEEQSQQLGIPLASLEEIKEQATEKNIPTEDYIQQVFLEELENKIESTFAIESEQETTNQSNQPQEPSSTNKPQKRSGRDRGRESVRLTKDEKEEIKLKEINDNLLKIKEELEAEITNVELMLNQLLKTPPNLSDDIKKEYDKKIQELIDIHNNLESKYTKTNQQLLEFKQKLDSLKELRTKRDNPNTTKDEKEKIIQKILSFETEQVNLEPLKRQTSVTEFQQGKYDTPFDEVIKFVEKHNPEITGLQLPRSVLEEKKQQLEEIKKTETPDVDTPVTPVISPPTTPENVTPASSLPRPVPPTNTPAPRSQTQQKTTSNYESAPLPKFDLPGTQSFEFKPLDSLNDTEKLTTPFDFETPASLNLENNEGFIPTTDLISNDLFTESDSLNDKKLDTVLRGNETTIAILEAIAEFLPSLANNTGNITSQPASNQNIQIPSTPNNKNSILPGNPNIPMWRTMAGVT